ncbi:MAG: hypothetical protein JW732_02890 [Dehalococcoidia bacterium]|nr:hypothetical protein [Dehalococcoidia bacterium]
MPGASLRISNVITPGNGNIEFIEYAAPKGDKTDLKICNVGVSRMAFEVDGIHKIYDALTLKEVKFNHPPLWLEARAPAI